ncbi:flavodoxin family protein [Streptomyces sp. 8N706]|uniref:flavodoxin family protein n=1 Tax=Streptomyces sp. 8N706 TaxID=3457416 RepID=UPI003FD29045
MSSHVLVAYHSDSGSVEELATAVESGARESGARTLLRRLGTGTGDTAADVLGDVLWAQVIAVGTPTYFGNVSAPVQRFLEHCRTAALAGALADKMVTAFTAGSSANGGQESVLLALHRSVAEWGALTLPTGYTDPAFRAVGGNPYGLSVTTGPGGPLDPGEAAMAGRALGRRAMALAERYLEPLARSR